MELHGKRDVRIDEGSKKSCTKKLKNIYKKQAKSVQQHWQNCSIVTSVSLHIINGIHYQLNALINLTYDTNLLIIGFLVQQRLNLFMLSIVQILATNDMQRYRNPNLAMAPTQLDALCLLLKYFGAFQHYTCIRDAFARRILQFSGFLQHIPVK